MHEYVLCKVAHLLIMPGIIHNSNNKSKTAFFSYASMMVMVLGIIMVAELKKRLYVEADVEEDDGYKKT